MPWLLRRCLFCFNCLSFFLASNKVLFEVGLSQQGQTKQENQPLNVFNAAVGFSADVVPLHLFLVYVATLLFLIFSPFFCFLLSLCVHLSEAS